MGIVVGVCGIVGEPGGKIVFEILFGRQLFLGVGVIAGRGAWSVSAEMLSIS